MSINQETQEKQANIVVDERLNAGEYEIACNNCGKSILGPVSGNFTDATLILMGLSSTKCPNQCNSSWVIHINPNEGQNKYSKDNPYPSE